MKEKQARARFKLEAVRLVNDGQSVGVTAKVLGGTQGDAKQLGV